MIFTPTTKQIRQTVKMFNSLKESGEVFKYSFYDDTHEHEATLLFRHCVDHCGDISILTLRFTTPEFNEETNFLPTETKEVINCLNQWYEQENIN